MNTLELAAFQKVNCCNSAIALLTGVEPSCAPAQRNVIAITTRIWQFSLSYMEGRPMVETSLGQQYLKATLAKWRDANPWASDVPWERIPSRYRNEIEQAARSVTAKSHTVSPSEDVVREIEDDDLAA
jgi:hypothetical protein